jgi:anti-sigma regulatory factor (Ser/Thr protein kinase)
MSDAVAIELPLEPDSARRARERLKPFRGALDETTFLDLRLLVDELVVEALLGSNEGAEPHEIQVRAELDGGRVRVVVAEGHDSYRLPSRRPDPGEPGFALHLVQRLSDRWGIRRDRNRATVWLELAAGSHRPV